MNFASIARAVSFALFVALPGHALAQAPEIVDLEEARATARAAAFDVATAQAALRSAEVGVREAWARVSPVLVLSAGATLHDREVRIDLPAVPGVDVDAPVLQERSHADVGVTGDVVLVDAALPTMLRSARYRAEAAEANLATVRDAVDMAAIELVYQAAAVEALRVAAEEQIATLRAHADTLASRLDVGLGLDLDLRRAELALREAELEHAELGAAHRALLRALGELLGGVEIDAIVAPVDTDASTLASDGSETTHEVAAAAAGLAASVAAARAARVDLAPRLVASGRWTTGTAEAVDGDHSAWAVSLGVRWTPYARGTRVVQARRAQSAEVAADATLAAAVARSERRVADAIDARVTADRRVAIAASRVAVAEEAVRLARDGFRAGALVSLDVLEAEQALHQARALATRARLERDLAAWRVRFASGGS